MCASPLVAIDVGATHVSCAQFSPGRKAQRVLQQFERETIVAEAVGDTAWVAAVGAALEHLARRTRWRGAAHVSIPGHLALTRCARTPRVAPAKLGAVMAFEASLRIPYPLEQVEWDYVVNAECGEETEVLLLAAKSEPMHALCDAVTASGFELSRVVPASVALAHVFQLSYPDVHSAAIIDVGARSTHVILLEGGRVMPRTLQWAGNTLTQAIAEALDVEFGRAEAIKLRHLRSHSDSMSEQAPHAIVTGAARTWAERLGLEVSRSIANARQQASNPAPQAVYLTGRGGSFDALAGWFQEQLALPVHRLDPLRSGAVVRRGGGTDRVTDLTDVVGLAALGGDTASSGNLLPARWRAVARFRRRQPVILAIAALLTATSFPPIWSYDRETRNARVENAAIAGEIRVMQAKVEQHAAARMRLEQTHRQLGALRQLTETKTNWTGFFAELQHSLVLVGDVWLDGLEVDLTERAAAAVGEPTSGRGEALLRLRLNGRMLDYGREETGSANEAERRVQRLLASVGQSRFVRTVEAERFDTSEPGILRFEFSVSVTPGSFL